jgi:hypothetical protein
MKDFIEFIKSLSGLIVAVTALVGALFPVVKWEVDRTKKKRKSVQTEGTTNSFPRSSRISTIIFGAIFFVVMTIRYIPEHAANREKLMTTAYDAFNAGKYDSAIQQFDAVITDYRGDAEMEQMRLAQNQNPQPPLGKVSAEQKEQIFSHGLLNDVAAAYVMKGKALEKLSRKNEAIATFSAATNFTYARVYTPGEDTFWSPSDAALGKLRQLQSPP